MNSDVNDTLPVSDDMSSADQEQALLDAVLANSPIMEDAGVPLPDEEEIVQDPEESVEVEDDLEETEEAVSEDDEEEYEEEVEEAEDEDAAEEAATQEADVFTADDLDLDAQFVAKVDGEELTVTFGDMIKNFQTDAHLSKKGRELGEAQKAFEEEKAQQLAQIEQLGQASTAVLLQEEQAHAKSYHELEDKINKAREDGDTYEVQKLKDDQDQVQKKYWKAKQKRDELVKQVDEQRSAVQQEEWQKQIEHFHTEIPKLIPDFNENVAKDIREFALKPIEDGGPGLNAEILDSIADPRIVYAMYDYMNLKNGIAKGTAKRKAVPAKKAVPSKKAKTPVKKAEDKAKMVKARAMREDATQDDQDAFLKQLASRSLSNL